ncbi:MAG: acetyl-CoA carboxylase biotin carboxyl carrier protein subunit, partial [Deltaproteobacteria bacterium]|nr:acetyl-CoA carboxylase biotin carboxyl carrier protein subunit [Deltaproteobacteria bacterium]
MATKRVEVRTPMSGIFYRKPAPDQPSYAEIGKKKKKKQVLGLLETMKVFQKIKSPANGT